MSSVGKRPPVGFLPDGTPTLFPNLEYPLGTVSFLIEEGENGVDLNALEQIRPTKWTLEQVLKEVVHQTSGWTNEVKIWLRLKSRKLQVVCFPSTLALIIRFSEQVSREGVRNITVEDFKLVAKSILFKYQGWTLKDVQQHLLTQLVDFRCTLDGAEAETITKQRLNELLSLN